MKPTSSALRQFLVGAIGTVALSSTLSLCQQQQPQHQHQHQQQVLLQDKQRFVDRYNANLNANGSYNESYDDDSHGGGLLLQQSPAVTKLKLERTEKGDETSRSPCHPDLGILACPKPGESCQQDQQRENNSSSSSSSIIIHNWYCVSRNDSEHSNEDSNDPQQQQQLQLQQQTKIVSQQQTKAERRFLFDSANQFPPSGAVYDSCTYDKQLEYNYYSTIRQPSAWDRCACKGYGYDLPSQSTIYTDVDYCHHVNIYYCKAYYNDRESGRYDPSSYDACLCTTYAEANKEHSIPNKASDFCTELPYRYCKHYFPNGDLVGGAECLCDNFDYQQFCDFVPPPGFVPVTPPTPAPGGTDTDTTDATDTTTTTTAPPSKHPTRKPSYPPTRNPTRNPTADPTTNPTRTPTATPTRTPTHNPTQKPVSLSKFADENETKRNESKSHGK